MEAKTSCTSLFLYIVMITSTTAITTNTTELQGCPPDKMLCGDGSCVPSFSYCDGVRECPDGSDETDCPSRCPPGKLRCGDGSCLPSYARCDGVADCPDASDELGCTSGCPPDEMLCGDGSCVSSLYNCDGFSDCVDGSDEIDCPPKCSLYDKFQCEDGSCVVWTAVCDGILDCPDSSDENNCPPGCTPGEFQCGDGSCLPSYARCDGRVDCPDASDEIDCPPGGNIHLKAMVGGGGTDIVEKDGWVKVTEKGLSQVSLTCTAQLFPAGGIVPLHSSVFWRKDDNDLPQHNSSIVPANIYSLFQAQGTYWCEVKRPNSTDHYVSNKVLLTLEGQEVLLLHLHVPPNSSVNSSSLESKVHGAFSKLLYDANYTVNAVSINKHNFKSSTSISARVQIHLSSTTTAFEKLLGMLHIENSIKTLLEERGFQSSMAFFSTRRRERKDTFPYGNSATWPFSEVGEVQPLHYRCEDAHGNLVVGHCRWNYTHGATIHFDRRKCKRFDFCPLDYTGLAGAYCVSRTSASTWDEGFRAAYTSKHTMCLLDTAHPMLYEKSDDLDVMSLYQQVKQWLEDDGESRWLWLPAKRLAPFAPLAILSPNFKSTYENFPNSNGWLSAYDVSWAAGQPSATHDCLALDTKTSTMLTLPCHKELPFLTILHMRKLLEVPNWRWKETTPGLITNDNIMCPGWSSEYPGGQEVCFMVCQNEAGLRWDEAVELCKEKDAQLPDPSNGFLDWALRQYMFSFNESIWITFRYPESNITKETRATFLNWKAETDHSLPYPALTPWGWIRHGSEVTKTHVVCQKNVSLPKINIQVFEEFGSVHVAVKPQTGTLPKCYVNGHWKSLMESPGSAEETGSGSGSMIFNDMEYGYADYGSGDGEPDSFISSEMVVNSNNEGYYKCWAWTDSPPKFLLSDTLLHRRTDTISFAIVLHRQRPYVPELHDATINNPETFPSDDSCMVDFLEQVQMNVRRLYDNVYVTKEDLYFSPEEETNNLLVHFHVQFEFRVEISKPEENVLYEMIRPVLSDLFEEGCYMSVRSTVDCYEETQGNLTWPRTMGAKVAVPTELCVTEEGNPVTRKCLGDFISGYYWGNKSGECTDQVSNKTQQLWSIYQNSSSSDSALVAELTHDGHSLNTTDVHFTARIVQSISNESSVTPSNLEHIVETLNNVMEAEENVIQQMQDVFNTSSILLQALETISFKTELPHDSKEQEVLCDSRLVSLARVSLMPNSSIIGYHSWRASEEEKEEEDENVMKKQNMDDWLHSQISLILPDNLTQQVAEDSASSSFGEVPNRVQILFAVYRTSKLFDDNSSFPNHSVDGHIIQAAYSGRTITNLEQPVKIYFKTKSTGYSSQCVFWDFTKNKGRGGWSTVGCWNTGRHGDYVLCQCYHLTSFAHLVNYDEESFGGIHKVIMDTISIIGCVLSITSLLMVLVTFSLFKKWRRRLGNQILVSLACAIMISFVVFLTGIQQTMNPIMCRAVAVTLHYFILASFGWMLVEAVHQYLRLVKVLGVYIPRFMRKASICAWGIPLVPVVIVLAYDPSLYDSDRNAENLICWMSSTAFSYAFLLPLTATMATNMVLFGLIIHSTTCGRVRVTSTQTKQQLRIIQLQMAVSVFSLLGFTWLFGLLTFWQPNLVFSYLFCITNTTQGFFIFLFHVFRERDARKLWKDWLSRIGIDLNASQNSTSLPTPKTSQVPQNSSATTTATPTPTATTTEL
uniref:Lipoprotein receptor n=1 Tax=Callinectes sapidus TaxID=6763 RepID=H6CSZ0_CALSI|nr:lipoprotein receptor [Callinectes sapidus]